MPQTAQSPAQTIGKIRQQVRNAVAAFKESGDWPASVNGVGFFEHAMKELNACSRKMIDGAEDEGRSMTSEETALVDQSFAVYDLAQQYHEKGNESAGRKTSPHGVYGDGSPSRKPSQWIDQETGRTVTMVNSTEKLADATDGVMSPAERVQNDACRGVPAEELLAAIIRGTSSSPAVNAAMQTTRDSSGGYALSTSMSREVLDLARSKSVVVQAGARTVVMPAQTLKIISIDRDPVGEWVPEGAALPTTDAAFGQRTLRAFKFGCIFPVTREMFMGAPNLVEQVRTILGIVAGSAIDTACLRGTGASNPLGLLVDEDVTENAIDGSVDWDHYLDSQAAIAGRNGMANAIIMPPSVKLTLDKLKDGQQQYLTPPASIANLPKLTTTKLESSESIIGNFTEMLIGTWQGISIEISSNGSTAEGQGFNTDHRLIKLTWLGDAMALRSNFFEKLTGIE